MNISFVIPNKNGEKLLVRHLPKVLEAAGKHEVIVVDDGSTDGSKRILKNFPAVTVVDGDGCGFASAVNKGVKQAQGEIVVLLNTDIEPHIDFLEPLYKHFDDPQVFAVGCLDKSHEPDGSIVLRGRGVAKWNKGFFVHQKGNTENYHDTAWVSGGSSAFRKDVWNKLGGMDELFNPFYWEDIDLSYRAMKAGYKILFEPESIVDHYHQTGVILTAYPSSYIRQIAFRNQLFFIWKNIDDLSMMISHIIHLPIFLIRSLVKDTTCMVGFMRAIVRIPNIFYARYKAKKFWNMHDREMEYPTFI